jgi:hypothetical protein
MQKKLFFYLIFAMTANIVLSQVRDTLVKSSELILKRDYLLSYYNNDTTKTEFKIQVTIKRKCFGKRKTIFNGSYLRYSPNGSLLEDGQYYNGNKVGEWSYYDSTGKFLRRITHIYSLK